MSCILVAHLPSQTYALDLMQKLMENSLTFMVSSKTDDIMTFTRSKLDDQLLMASDTPATSSVSMTTEMRAETPIQDNVQETSVHQVEAFPSYSPVPAMKGNGKKRKLASQETKNPPVDYHQSPQEVVFEPLLPDTPTTFDSMIVKEEYQYVEVEDEQPSSSFDYSIQEQSTDHGNVATTRRVFTRKRTRNSLLSIGIDELLFQSPSIVGGCWFAKGVVRPLKTTDFPELLLKCNKVILDWPPIESTEVGSLFFFGRKKNARSNETATPWKWHGQKKFKDTNSEMIIMRNYKRHLSLKLTRYMFYGNLNGEDTPALYQYMFLDPVSKHQLKEANFVGEKVEEGLDKLPKGEADDDEA